MDEFPLVHRGAPGTRLVVAIAPAFTIGFVRPSGLRSIPASELNGISGGVRTELRARRVRADQLANQREHKRLRHAHDREFVLGVADGVDIAAGGDHAHAEQLARHSSQCRINV